MELAIQITLGLVALICLAGGLNLLLKGAGSFLPEKDSAPVVLDNLFRFMSGIYFGMGVLFGWTIFNLDQAREIIYFLGLIVAFSGLGRLYSRITVGSGGTYLDAIMVFEMVLGLGIILMQYFR